MGAGNSTLGYTPCTPEELPKYVKQPGQEHFWTSDGKANKPIVLAEKGLAARKPVTVVEAFREAVRKYPEWPALRVEKLPHDDHKVGEFKTWTWREYYLDTEAVARAFIRLGLQQHQSINILGFNSPEWVIANMAAIMAGGKAAGIYSTNTPDACHYISQHSEAVVVVVEDLYQLGKYLEIRDQLPLLRAIVMWSGEVPADANQPGKAPVLSWAQLVEMGRYEPPKAAAAQPPLAQVPPAAADAAAAGEEEKEKEIEAAAEPAGDGLEQMTVEQAHKELQVRIKAQEPGMCCTLIYTSGTTGVPKAVMISHDNLTWTIWTFLTTLPPNPKPKLGEHLISYLPLSHIAAQAIDIHAPIGMCLQDMPATVTFARPTALKGSLPLTLAAVHPTFFFGVPRVWEKIQEKMIAIGKQTTGLKKSIATWAKGKGAASHQAHALGGSARNPWGFGLANALVFKKVKAKLGLDRSRINLVAAAPIRRSTVDFFGAFDVRILELYGMSECTGPQNFNMSGHYIPGSVGVPLPGSELKIDHVAGRDESGQGEICYRGRHIMMGYMKEPEKTAAAIDDEGWLHSEDVGRIDERGMLYITGRIKDLIIGAGGENIPPVPVQDSILQEMPALSNVIMVGDKQKYNVGLCTVHLVPNEDGSFSNVLTGPSKEVDPECKTVEEAQKSDKWRQYIADGLARANSNKELVKSNAWKCQKLYLLPTDFSVTTGELTATLKLKRAVVEKKYAEIIESMYDEAAKVGIEASRAAGKSVSRPAPSAAEEKEAEAQAAEAAPAVEEAQAAEAAPAVEEAQAAEAAPAVEEAQAAQ